MKLKMLIRLPKTYINLPILLKPILLKKISLEAGPQIGLAISKRKSTMVCLVVWNTIP
jgi:hypothetical protein